MNKKSIILSIFVIILIIMFITTPQLSIQACLSGIIVWATNLLPALLPFFIFTKLLSELGFITQLSNYIAPITKKLYNTGGVSGYVYIMSILSGYPVGAKLTADLYENKLITRSEAHRMVTFTSTSGPLFIIGTVAIGMLNNYPLGIIILISHFVSALLNGLIYRKYTLAECSKISTCNSNDKTIIEQCMYSSIYSIVLIGGYVSIFFMLITMFNYYNIFYPINWLLSKLTPNINLSVVNSILNGTIELTRGCLDLSTLNINTTLLTVIISALVSFGGICINMQALCFLQKINISTKFFVLQKITHTIISIIVSFLLCLILL